VCSSPPKVRKLSISLTHESLVAVWEQFFKKYCKSDVADMIYAYPVQRSLVVDYRNLEKENIELADHLLNKPSEALCAGEEALRSLLEDVEEPSKELARIHLRVKNLSEVNRIPIRNLRSEHLGKLVAIEGLIKKVTEVRPKMEDAFFQCKVCGTTIKVHQEEDLLTQPLQCYEDQGGCGRTTGFKLLIEQSKFIDQEKVEIQESPELLRGGEQPQCLTIYIEDDLVGQLAPGDRAIINGVVRTQQRRRGTLKLTEFDKVLDVISIEQQRLAYEEVSITREDEEAIKELAKNDDIYDKLRESIAPTIWGLSQEKEALVLQLFGGIPKLMADGTRIRGDIHVLLVGDPSTAKSQLLRYVANLTPRSIYASGKTSSAAGLCVSPNTLISLSNGEIVEIGNFAEKRMSNPMRVREGIWEQKSDGVKLSTIGNELDLQERELRAVWKLKSPKRLAKVTTRTKREITVSKNTPLPIKGKQGIEWIKANELKKGLFLAIPRCLPEPKNRIPYTIELIDSDCVVEGVNDLVKKVAILLKNKYGRIRNASRELGINEEILYHNWVNEGGRENIHLKELCRLCKEANVPRDEVAKSIKFFSQQAGHRIKLPAKLSKEMLYFAGLIVGEGSICKTNFGGYAIRFSNSNAFLMKRFAEISKSLFDIEAKIMEGNEKRPTEGRFNSKLVGEIFNNLGVPFSPKSDKSDLSNKITKLPNSYLSAFLRGLFDCEGSISLREKGSSSVELYTTNEKLIKKLQIVLSRFGIISKLRRREKARKVAIRKDGKRIESKSDVFVLSVYGSESLQLFKKHIGFSHPERNAQLEAILSESYHSNWDFVPRTGQALKQIRETFGINASRVGISSAFEHEKYKPRRNNLQNLVNRLAKEIEEGRYEGKRITISRDLKRKIKRAIEETKAKDIAAHLQISVDRAREYFYRPDRKNKIPFLIAERFCAFLNKKGYKNLAKEIKDFTDFGLLYHELEESRKSLELLQKLSRSGIFWDEIKEIKEVESNSNYIYDLTVEDSHNFIANGVLVHNTAAAVKDEFGEGRWSLEAGTLVLADLGIACIDELDKINAEDRSALHQAMEQQEISIAKAGINTTLKSRCSLLGAANPKYGRFDETLPLPDQIDMPPTLLSRFDLIFPLIDKPNREEDEKLATHMLKVHKLGEQKASKRTEISETEGKSALGDEIEPRINPLLLRKYIAWAKRNVVPVLNEDAKELIKRHFVELREASSESIQCTPRQLEALIRLAESSAKARLSREVELSDAKRGMDIMDYFLQKVGLDRETGKIDIDIIATGKSRVQQTNMQKLMGIIKALAAKSPDGMAPRSEIIGEGELEGIPVQKIEELLLSLKREGLIYEPRPDKLDLVRK